MSYIRLPDRTFSLSVAPYKPPQWSYGSSGSWQYGRQNGLDNFTTIGGMPTNICSSYSSNAFTNIVQFTPTQMFVNRILTTDLVTQPSSNLAFANDFLCWLPSNPSKGLQWKTVNFITNFANFPIPGLPDGVIVAQLARNYYKTTNICFPEGSISCNTTMGARFPGRSGFINNPNFVTLAGAGCPSSNNWGVAYIDPTSEDKTITISDGSGSSGVQPFARPNNLYNIFQKTNRCGAVQINSNRIAYLSDSSYANFGTLLTIARFGTNASPGAPNQCNGDITLNCYTELQIDLQALVGGDASYSNVYGLWSDGNGLLACCVSNNSFRKVVIIQYPGPVVQVIAGIFSGGAPSINPFAFIYNGYLGIAFNDGFGDPIVGWSSTQIDMTYKFSLPVNTLANSVNQSNIVENISARGF